MATTRLLSVVLLSAATLLGATPPGPAPTAGDRASPADPPALVPDVAALDMAQLKQQAATNGPVPVLVALTDGRADPQLSLVDELAGTASTVRTVTDDVLAVRADTAGLDRLAGSAAVASIGPDHQLRIDGTGVGAVSLATAALGQGGANATVPPGAGTGDAHRLGLTGRGGTVVLIDTGVAADHPSLAGAVVAEACFLAGVGGTCPDGQPAQVGPGAGRACNRDLPACGHGTHVAGILAGRPHGPHPVGIAPGVGLVPIQIFAETAGGGITAQTSDLIAALDHVVQLSQSMAIDAVNLSISGQPLFTAACDTEAGQDPAVAAVAEQVGRLRTAGIAVVTATGNGGSPDGVSFPSCLSGVVRVAATGADGALAGFSNRNREVVLAAPGVDVVSAEPGGGSTARSGTSMAAPHVTGAIALLRQRYVAPEVDWLVGRLRVSGRPVADGATGRGLHRLDVAAALGISTEPGAQAVPAAGAWIFTDRGRVLPLGRAPHHGTPPALPAGERLVAAAGQRSGLGYWAATDRGRVLAFGDAPARGDVSHLRLNRPITAMAATPSGQGYWLLGGDGGIFTFGDAGFRGSTGGMPLRAPVTDLAASPSGQGYWLAAGDGGVFTFGDARFHGSAAGVGLRRPITSIAAGPGNGYWLVGLDGGVFSFDVPFFGSLPGIGVTGTGLRVRASAGGAAYHLLTAEGGVHPFGRAEPLGPAPLTLGERAIDLVVLP